jgi:predicted transcriptional regulator
MPTTVRLDPATRRVMGRLAHRRGLTKSQLIRQAIRRLGESDRTEQATETVYDAMEHAIGGWDSGGAQLSGATDERFKALLRARPEGRGGVAARGGGRTRRRAAKKSSRGNCR